MPRMLRSADKIDVTSLITRMPRSPILRSRPPVAVLRASRWRGCRQQRALAGDRPGHVGAGARQRLHGFGLGGSRPRDDEQPQRIAGQAFGGSRWPARVERVEVVFVADHLVKAACTSPSERCAGGVNGSGALLS